MKTLEPLEQLKSWANDVLYITGWVLTYASLTRMPWKRSAEAREKGEQ
jgi:hypothetical protein